MEKELISVIVACYNVESFIKQCIDSIIVQTYSNIEIIVINDGSTDSTLDILKQFSFTDERIKIVNQLNRGLSEVRNIGAKTAKGAFLIFVDGDDWLDHNYLEILFKNTSGQDLVCCSYNRVFEDKIKRRFLGVDGIFSASFIQRRIVGLVDSELKDPSQADSLVTAWGKLYKTNTIKDSNCFFIDTKLIGTEDALFNIEYLQFSDSVCIIDLPLYFYRKYNANSLTSNYKPKLFEQWKSLYSHLHLKIIDKDLIFAKAYHNRICLSIIGLGLNELLSKSNFRIIVSRFRIILDDPLYTNAFQTLELRYFPIHWKLFFFLAKKRLIFPLILMLKVIKKMINK